MHQMAKSIASTFEPWQRKRLARCMSAFAALGCRLSIGIELECYREAPRTDCPDTFPGHSASRGRRRGGPT